MEELKKEKIKKPKGRIIVLIYQLYGAIMVSLGLVYNLLIRFDLVSADILSQAQIEQIKAVPLIWILFGMSLMLIRVVGGILLFALKKAGFFLLALDAIIQTTSLALGVLKGFNAGEMGMLVSMSAIIVCLIAIAIAFYSWCLYRKDLLN